MSRAKLETIRNAKSTVLPSLLLCDFGDLKGEVAKLHQAGTEVLHLDVMDGHFVPNMTYAMPIVEGLRRHTEMPLDVHLMISDPVKYAQPMADAGADLITFHAEAVNDVSEAAGKIADLDVGVGVALNPGTSLSKIEPCLDQVDLVLVMSVDAGFGGQSFNPVALEKLRELRHRDPSLLLEIDGGINARTIGEARQAGCDLFVVGSAIFRADDYSVAIRELDHLVDEATITAEDDA
ncbi:MAG: ribulose-phosphate 3-epimerase [Planctomycetota bacterium]